MALVVNERDVLMQLTVPRFQISSQTKSILLSADSPVFKVAANGTGTPAQVKVSADLLNIAGVVNFTVDNGSTISVLGNVATLEFANMTTQTATISASVTENGVTYAKSYIINKIADGAVVQLLTLDVPTQNFKYDAQGAPTPSGQALTFSALLKNITGVAVFTCSLFDSNNANLGAVTLGGTNNIRTLTSSQFGVAAYAIVTATLGSLTDTVSVVRLQDGATGSNGSSALAGYLTNEAHTVSTFQDGSAPDFSTALGAFKVFLGTTDVTSNCTFSIVGSPLVTAAIGASTGLYSATGEASWAASSRSTTVTFRATYLGATIDKVFSLTKAVAGIQGSNGLRGNVNLSVNGQAVWSDSVAVAAIVAAGFGSVQNQDIITEFDATHSVTKFYNAGVWSVLTSYINGNLLVDGTVAAKALNIGIGGRNLCDNSGPMPGNARGYSIAGNTTGQSASVNPTNSDWCPSGANAAYVALGGNPTGYLDVIKVQADGNHIRAIAGARYEGSMYLSAHRCTAQLYLQFLNSGGSVLSSVRGSSITTAHHGASTSLESFGRSVVFAIAPAGTTWIRPFISTEYSGQSNPYTFWSGLYVAECSANQTIPSPWEDNGMTLIDGAGIRTNTVNADRLVAASITGDKMAANTITADKMSVNNLAALSANLGNVTAGDLYSVNVHGGSGYPHSGYAWPTNGGNGFHLSASGLLLGNANTGRYFQLTDTGDMYTPQFTIVGGAASFYGNINTTGIVKGTGNTNWWGGQAAIVGEPSGAYGIGVYGGSQRAHGVFGFSEIENGVHGRSNGTGVTGGNAVHGEGWGSSGGGYFYSEYSAGVVGSSTNGTGSIGYGSTYDFYAMGPGANYGPFTGSHDGLTSLTEEFSGGDIVADISIHTHFNVSNTIAIVSKSTSPVQKNIIGVYIKHRELISANLITSPAALVGQDLELISQSYKLAIFNGVGEGQVNVCGENGNLEAGDLIVSSSIAGKGMKQSDNIVRSHTVAKCRENVTFSSPSEIKMVACIYLCG
jgi:hypothetical protein